MLLLLLLAAGEPLSVPARVGRVGVEVAGGAVAGGVAIVGGAVLGTMGDHGLGREASVGLAIGSAVGAALGTAPGVWTAGYLMGGDGSWWWTLLGSTAGTLVSAGLLAIKPSVEVLGISAVFPLAGAILGYELSSSGTRRAAPASVQVFPTANGVAGVF